MKIEWTIIREIAKRAQKLGRYEFDNEWLVSHYDQIETTQEECEALVRYCHPDSDEHEWLEFLIEDLLQPMLNHLDQVDEEYFSQKYIDAEIAKRESFAESWLGKQILEVAQ